MIKVNSLTLLYLILSIPILAQGNDECLMCHGDNELTGKVKGRTISVYVNELRFSNSVHSDVECLDCHQDINAENLPHRETFKRVDR